MAEILPPRKAISDLVHDGDVVPMEGFTLSFAAGHEVIRQRLPGKGPVAAITDLCIMEPGEETKDLTVRHLHPGVARREVEGATGWPVRFADMIRETPPPNGREIETLRDLDRRTAVAHGGGSAKAEQGRGSLAPRK